jgi:hypothetical protein
VGLLEVSHPGPDRVLPHPVWSGLAWVASVLPATRSRVQREMEALI